jgi:hypothetical protein
MIERHVEISQSGKVWLVLAAMAVLLYVLWQLSGSIANGDTKGALMLGAGFVAFFVAGRITGNWQTGVYFFFIWLVFEDLIRKYMGNSMYVYFAKDILVGVTYLSFLASNPEKEMHSFRPPFRFALGVFVLFGLVQVFNPLSPSIFYGLLGLKLYFYYVPLMYIGYAMLRHEADLRKFLLVTMSVAGVVAVVGILQTIIGLDFLNPHGGADIDELGHTTRYTSTGIAVARPPSVFVSDGRFAQFLVVAFAIGMGSAGYVLLRQGRGRKIVFPAVALVALASTLSGGRGAFVFTVVSGLVISVGMLWGAPAQLAAAYRLVKALRRSFITIAMAGFIALTFFPSTIGAPLAFYRETIMPDSEYSESGARAWDYPVSELKIAMADPYWALGHGIGTGSLGVQYVSRILEAPPTNVGVEGGCGALIVEFGIMGPILWVFWAGTLVISSWRVALKLRGTWAFPLAMSIAWYVFLLLFPMTWGTMVDYQNFVVNAYLWILVGVLFRLPELVKQSEEPSAALPATTT